MHGWELRERKHTRGRREDPRPPCSTAIGDSTGRVEERATAGAESAAVGASLAHPLITKTVHFCTKTGRLVPL